MVNPNNIFFVDEVQTSAPDKDELYINANVRFGGEIRQGESPIAPTEQSALALTAENEGVKAVMCGTPDPVWFRYKVPFATGQVVSMGGGGAL